MLNPKERISALSNAHLLSSAIHAAAELRIADILFDKPKLSVDRLAKELKVNPRPLFRLLRFLASHEIFSQNEDETFSLNPESAYLADKHPESIRHTLLVNEGPRWNAMGAISKAVIKDKPAFDALYDQTYYEYLEDNPEASKRFNAHMTTYTQEEDRQIAPLLPIEHVKTLVDVGGGEGQFLNELLQNFPTLYAILFDLEVTLSNKKNIKIRCDQNRWEIQKGSFFDSIPLEKDAYILKRVLHNWSKENCIKILKNIRKSMKADGKIFIIEGIVPEDSSHHPSKDSDLFLMTLFSGCERTKNEFQELAELADLQISRILPTNTFLSIIELKRAKKL